MSMVPGPGAFGVQSTNRVDFPVINDKVLVVVFARPCPPPPPAALIRFSGEWCGRMVGHARESLGACAAGRARRDMRG
jgi:hypothetical protein